MSVCPSPFQNIGNNTCLVRCPSGLNLSLRNDNGQYSCVYNPDNRYKVNLVPVGALQQPIFSLSRAERTNPELVQDFVEERNRYNNELGIVYSTIEKEKKVNDAFKRLQSAENARDAAPEAYQIARNAYYTLVKGQGWLAEERERIAKAEVAPEAQKYREAVNTANARSEEQQKTIEIANGLKDRVLSLKDDFKYSVNTFSDQLEKLKIQINMENRAREKEKDNTWAWIDTILNVLLVAVLVYAVYTFVRRYFISRRPPGVPMTTIRVPTYTGQPVYR